MLTQSIQKDIAASGDEDVFTSGTWSYVVARLNAGASGTNYIGAGGQLAQVAAGDVLYLLLAPDTQLKVRTTSGDTETWTFIVTELVVVEQVLGALCQIAANLAAIAGGGG